MLQLLKQTGYSWKKKKTCHHRKGSFYILTKQDASVQDDSLCESGASWGMSHCTRDLYSAWSSPDLCCSSQNMDFTVVKQLPSFTTVRSWWPRSKGHLEKKSITYIWTATSWKTKINKTGCAAMNGLILKCLFASHEQGKSYSVQCDSSVHEASLSRK